MIGLASVREEEGGGRRRATFNAGWRVRLKPFRNYGSDGRCYKHNIEVTLCLKWHITARIKLPRTSTLLRTRGSCGISFRGEWGKEVFSLLSLRSAVRTVVFSGVESIGGRLGGEMFAWQLLFVLTYVSENQLLLTVESRSEISDLVFLVLRCGASWIYRRTLYNIM